METVALVHEFSVSWFALQTKSFTTTPICNCSSSCSFCVICLNPVKNHVHCEWKVRTFLAPFRWDHVWLRCQSITVRHSQQRYMGINLVYHVSDLVREVEWFYVLVTVQANTTALPDWSLSFLPVNQAFAFERNK